MGARKLVLCKTCLIPKNFSEITFRPTRFQGNLNGTRVEGRNTLLILLTGSNSRSRYQATGYPRLVGDTISLRIIARIAR